jgi:hypothetical protein
MNKYSKPSEIQKNYFINIFTFIYISFLFNEVSHTFSFYINNDKEIVKHFQDI